MTAYCDEHMPAFPLLKCCVSDTVVKHTHSGYELDMFFAGPTGIYARRLTLEVLFVSLLQYERTWLSQADK